MTTPAKIIRATPQGYQTHLTERGLYLLGGQRQLTALAPMILKDPPILILAEGTSALDNTNIPSVNLRGGAGSSPRCVAVRGRDSPGG
jgi:ABC-type bacteriocin/lantibiotic exporter with double-glycine peptidase domain